MYVSRYKFGSGANTEHFIKFDLKVDKLAQVCDFAVVSYNNDDTCSADFCLQILYD